MWSIFWKSHIGSKDAPVKFVPLSDLIILNILPHPMKRLKLKMNKSVLKEWKTSICIALLERKYIKHYISCLLLGHLLPQMTQRYQYHNMYVNGGSMHILSFGKSATFCCRDRLLNCLHLTHLPIIDRSNELQLMIKKKKILFGWLWDSVSICDFVMTPSYYQFTSFAGLWQLSWMLNLICHISQFFPKALICHLGPGMDLILIS